MIQFNSSFKTQFRAALTNYHQSLWNLPLSREMDFIDRTVASFRNLNIRSEQHNLKTRSKRIHLTPQVRFYRSPLLLAGKHTTVEMGDLLLIFKHFLNGTLNAYRGIIVQAKYTKGNKRSWKIDADQFYFLTQWPRFQIARPTSKTWHAIKPRAFTWATYGFVGLNATGYPIYYSSARMLRRKRTVPPTKSFSFSVQSRSGWDSSTSFLLKFIQGFVGENLLSNAKAKAFVHDLYTIMRWKPDPPGDLEWDEENSKESEGFATIEFTVSTENLGQI